MKNIIIDNYLKAKSVFNKADEDLHKYFKKKHEKSINDATSLEELNQIKEQLRIMPESVGKVLLFREIIIKEENIKQSL